MDTDDGWMLPVFVLLGLLAGGACAAMYAVVVSAQEAADAAELAALGVADDGGDDILDIALGAVTSIFL